MTAHLYRVILPVGDIESATSLYSVVLGAPGEPVSPGRHYFTVSVRNFMARDRGTHT